MTPPQAPRPGLFDVAAAVPWPFVIVFPPFRLDLEDARLWRDAEPVTVRRKPFAVLGYLAQHPHRLVTHEELLSEVWGGVALSESAIRSQVHELRQVLGEGVIETVTGRGYRFVGRIVADVQDLARVRDDAAGPSLVGRDDELHHLRTLLGRARGGRRQLVFVSGEPGVGKTSLVDAFIAEYRDDADIVIGRGQCVEQYGAPEAYLAIMDAVRQLCQSRHRARVLALLVRHAPTLLVQMPNLVPDGQLDELQKRASAGSQARMLRELIEAFEAISAEHPVVLVLEDLQWSDLATNDFLALLGRRRESSRILVIATVRRDELQAPSHPLNRVVRALVARDGAVLLAVEPIVGVHVQQYLDLRFPRHLFSPQLAVIFHQVTAGIPLFLVSLVDELVDQQSIVEVDGAWAVRVSLDELAAYRPASVGQLIDIQLDRLTVDEQLLLEAAGLLGPTISTLLLAAALELPPERVEELCVGLERRGLFLQRAPTPGSPDGTGLRTYQWTHALVQQICLERAPPSRQQRWHRAVAERLELAHAGRADDVAAVLATHFERAQLPARAAYYFVIAAERTVRSYATSDAVELYAHALQLLQRISAGAERDALELRLLVGYLFEDLKVGGVTLADADRVVELARSGKDRRAECLGLSLQALRATFGADYRRALALAAEVLALLSDDDARDPTVESQAHVIQLVAHLHRGELHAAAAASARVDALRATQSTDAEVLLVALMYKSLCSWVAGFADRALAIARVMVERAEAIHSPALMALAQLALARLHYLRRDPVADTRAAAAAVLDFVAVGDQRARAEASMLLRATGSDGADGDALLGLPSMLPNVAIGRTVVALITLDVLRRADRHAEAAEMIDELCAFAETHDEHVVISELLCQRGLLLEADHPDAAHASYQRAVEAAHAIGAHTLELRAATHVVRTASGEPRARAEERLRVVIAAHTEGFSTRDMLDARALVAR